jgi:PAS domain S-box-containing protein
LKESKSGPASGLSSKVKSGTLQKKPTSFSFYRNKFTSVFSGIPYGAVIVDNSTKIVAVNPSACKILLQKKTDLLKKNLPGILKSTGWSARGSKWKTFISKKSFAGEVVFINGSNKPVRLLIKAQKDFFGEFNLFLLEPLNKDTKPVPVRTASPDYSKKGSIIDNFSEGIIRVAKDKIITEMNPAASSITGWSRKEAAGAPLHDIFRLLNTKSSKPVNNFFDKVIDKGVSVRLPNSYVLVTKNGEYKRLICRAFPRKDIKDNLSGIAIVFDDITTELTLKERVDENQREYTTLMGNLNGLVYKCDYDEQWTMSFISSGAVQLTGYTPEELQFNNTISFAGLIHPDDRQDVFDKISLAILRKERFQITYRIITKDNIEKWVWEQGVAVYDNNGAVIRLEGFITDITGRIKNELELAEREKNLETILNSISDGVIVLNKNGVILRLNPAACKLTGTLAEFASGKYYSEIFSCAYWNSNKPLDIPVKKVIDEVSDFIPAGDIILHSANKKTYNIKLRVSPINVPEANLTGCIIVFSDITEEFSARQALKSRIISLTRPLDTEDIEFAELFDIDELQRIQDSFCEATGVASLITTPDGIPITKPSNFCRLCNDIIRGTEKGRQNCKKSDTFLGKSNPDGPLLNHCLSGGLFDAGASITIGKKHIASWLIGQVRDPEYPDSEITRYADEIGVNKDNFCAALQEVPVMSKEQFSKIANIVFFMAKELSAKAYQNVQQARLIADLNRTKTELFEREKNLAITLNSIGDGVISTDKSGFITGINPVAEKMTGWTLEEALGHKLMEVFKIINAETRKQVVDPVQIVLKKGIIVGLANHTVLIDKFGNERQIADSAAPIINNEGIITGVVLVFSDVTEQYTSQNALKESEKALRSSQRIAELGSYVFYIEENIWSCSDVLDEIFGIDISFEKSMEGWWTIIHPDWKETMMSYLLTDVLKNKGSFNKEYKIKRINDGAERWVHGRGELVLDSDGKPVKLVGTIQDITERKKALDELRKLSLAVENNPALVVITDKYGNIEYVNKIVLEMTGYTKEEVLGKNPRIWASGYHNELFYKEMWETITKGKIFKSELLNKKKNGELYWESALISSLVDNNGNITHYVSVNENITTKKEIIEELIIAKDRAEQSAKLKSEFLAQMSHEIRTPLNAILGIVSFLKDLFSDRLNNDTNHWFESLDIASDRIIRTVELILRAAELQTSGYKTHPVSIDLDSEVLAKLVKEFSHSAKQKGLQLIYKCNAANTKVIADEYCLTQIFANLIGNAIKYTGTGKVEIVIDSHNPRGLVVEVRDTGIGINREFLDRIFEPFTQEEQGYSRSYEGNGLGLALVKKYCELNNLTIEIESEKYVGSVFKVFFNNLLNAN